MRRVQGLIMDQSEDTKMDLDGGSADNYTSNNQTTIYESPMMLTDLPTTILESFIPGYRLISRLVYQATGIDINLFVSVFFVIAALATSIRFLWDRFYMLFSKYYMSSININDEDDLYQGVLDWIATRKVTQTARTLKAVTRTGKDWIKGFTQDSDDSIGSAIGDIANSNSNSNSSENNDSKTAGTSEKNSDLLGAGPIFNFKQLEARVGPRFEPYYGTHHFWFRGRLFIFQRTRRDIGGGYFSYMAPEEQLLTLSTPGRSTIPLKQLIREIKDWSFERQKNLTVIRRPRPKEKGRSYLNSWVKVTVRPSRSLDTVALDGHQKSAIVKDVNHFLHPATPLWYASRGIPYRRGYLFHGPPGTGKTSLVFALAGLFGLNIFCLSLLDPELSESQLIYLVNDLPYRSLVLLEDIDAAGLSRAEDESGEKQNANDSDDSDSDDGAAKSKKKKGKAKKSSISLSGLLNAIDGVAIQEGRLLVMTTNHPDRLDEALVRPGRVDMRVKFGLATHAQVYDIFVRMFQRFDEYAGDNYSLNSKASSARHREKAEEKEERLEDLAEQFAAKVPDCKLSPAEIQGFLLLHSEKPRQALDEVEAWCREKLNKT